MIESTRQRILMEIAELDARIEQIEAILRTTPKAQPLQSELHRLIGRSRSLRTAVQETPRH